jgi:predicted Zn-dependent protease
MYFESKYITALVIWEKQAQATVIFKGLENFGSKYYSPVIEIKNLDIYSIKKLHYFDLVKSLIFLRESI